MPELPEVETCCRGLRPHVVQRRITQVIIRHTKLRWPVSSELAFKLKNQIITGIQRRGKYLLFTTSTPGTCLLHLGMSGRLCVVRSDTPVQKHDHIDVVLDNGTCLRFNDSRRFGSLLWTDDDPKLHPLLRSLGPEPLTDIFDGTYLWKVLQRRSLAIKLAIMNNHIVVGVGNIYANEALFMAKIHPERPAKNLSITECHRLVKYIKHILLAAIECGGTTLKDFISVEGKPGYFQQTLKVYGRGGQACVTCQQALKETRLGQRSTVFCDECQR